MIDTQIEFTDIDELAELYDWEDCSTEIICPLESDGALNPQCQQAGLYQIWECEPLVHVPVDTSGIGDAFLYTGWMFALFGVAFLVIGIFEFIRKPK